MAIISEGIMVCKENGLCFGDYSIEKKLKVDGFDYNGDIYRVKTHNEVTRLEKNGKLLLESVPGSAVHNFIINEKTASFTAEGYEDTQITLELEPETEYKVYINGVNIGKMKTNLSGKITFSVELKSQGQDIKIDKVTA